MTLFEDAMSGMIMARRPGEPVVGSLLRFGSNVLIATAFVMFALGATSTLHAARRLACPGTACNPACADGSCSCTACAGLQSCGPTSNSGCCCS
jgi:hypothetical protein